MTKKTRKSEEATTGFVQEPAVAYQRRKSVDVLDWNPNVPVHATQEEWWNHFHQYPCYFTDEEKKNRIEQSVKDAEAGLGVTEEVMFNRHPEWL